MDKTLVIQIWLLLVTVICVNFSHTATLNLKKYERFIGEQGLYSQIDDVEILTVENFKNAIFNSDKAWLVEFYNSWCGFCRRFAPSWKDFATNIRGWRDLVVVAAIDCNNDENHPLCREYEIMGYPTLRYYPEKFNEEKNFGANMPRGITADDHRHDLLDKMIQEQQNGRGKQFPNLLPYGSTDVLNVFQDTSDDVQFALLIVQEPQTYDGPEVALDMHRTSSIVVRYAFSNNSDLVAMLRVGIFPSAYIIARDGNYNIENITPEAPNRIGIKESTIKYLKDKHVSLGLELPDKNIEDSSQQERHTEYDSLTEKVKKMGDVVFQVDLETAVRYSLKREVGGVKEITGDRLEALNRYLDILAKYFPFGKNGKIFLNNLRNYAQSSGRVQGREFFDMVKKAENDETVFSSGANWLGCHGSSKQYRGYPCGLWKLFHYLTVNAALDLDSRGDNPRIILEGMHGYIKNFFGCADCSQHFQEMASRRELNKVSSFNDSILWLWNAHNEVNKRLSGDLTEDPEFPKIQFPSKDNCPKCHNVEETWSIPEVLIYLKHTYNNININYMGADMKIIHLDFEGQRSHASDGIFKTVDTTEVPKKDVQVQARPTRESIMPAELTISSGATKLPVKDKASHLFALLCLLITSLGHIASDSSYFW
ncbi:sulfhydryl oxidase 1-like [Cylas formicarius]|uniref:sulfhydryl oxidase 1-like n=1 Tax=Cylas formicarius TaxID=197179 RepID=UPI00295850EF|nr:sulfhydryl oxidase 1-like [Cylas formicarius]